MTRCRGEQLARVRTRERLPSEAYQISDDRRLAHDLCIKTDLSRFHSRENPLQKIKPARSGPDARRAGFFFFKDFTHNREEQPCPVREDPL